MKKMLLGLSLVLCLASYAFADAPATKIADCSAPADAQNPAEQIQVFRAGSENIASALTVHLQTDGVDSTYPVVVAELQDGGQTLAIQYTSRGFLTLLIHEGNRSDDVSGVALGQSRAINCQASF